MRWFLSLVFAAGLWATTAVNAQSELPINGTVVFDLPETDPGLVSINSSLFVDVPAGTRQLRLELSAEGGTRNPDIFVRIGQPFPNDGTLQGIVDSADFYSRSPFSTDTVVVADFAEAGLAGARVHVALVIGEGAPASGSLTLDASTTPVGNVPITVDFDNLAGTDDCDVAPWNDPTAFTATGGNNATTLGAARRTAMLEAARLLSRELYSAVPITINACWANRGGDQNSANLAGARGNSVLSNSPGLPRADLLYVQAAYTRLAGATLSGLFGQDLTTEPDILITFNTDVDGPEALGNRGYFYGINGAANTSNDVDFLSVAMHEITHGLGFASTYDENGNYFFDDPDVFSANLIDNRNGEAISLADPGVTAADRVAVSTSVSGLQWSGPESSISRRNPDANFGDGYIRMNAPVEFQPGSSVSHVAQNYCELMTANAPTCVDAPFRSLELTRPMLHEVGWAPGADQPNYLGLMFDRERNGHGFEFALGGQDADGNDVYVLTFYTYRTLGRTPEWFQAVGSLSNGVFTGIRNPDGIGFAQFLYDDSRNPPQQADPDEFGQVVLNFNNPEDNDACNDGADRSGVESVAVLQFVLANQVDDWCVEPLAPTSSRPSTDFGGLYFAGEADTGWGFSLENIDNGDGTTSLFVLLYVYASDGTPVWFFGLDTFDNSLSGSLTLEMFQRTGFPRLSRNGSLSDESAGTLTLNLTQPSSDLSAGNRVSVNVEYQDGPGGSWIRDDVAIQRLSLARP